MLMFILRDLMFMMLIYFLNIQSVDKIFIFNHVNCCPILFIFYTFVLPQFQPTDTSELFFLISHWT